MGDEEALEDSEEIWQLHSLPDAPLLNRRGRRAVVVVLGLMRTMKIGNLGC